MNGRRSSVPEITTFISSWNGEKKRQKGTKSLQPGFEKNKREREDERERGLLIVDAVVGVAAAEI